ncbi:MAG: hypothetical protein GPJ29_22375 [Microcystis aeruginosa BK11-02]|nr:hypothetical protein [Microcystis aeruginosa BK11-02]
MNQESLAFSDGSVKSTLPMAEKSNYWSIKTIINGDNFSLKFLRNAS